MVESFHNHSNKGNIFPCSMYRVLFCKSLNIPSSLNDHRWLASTPPFHQTSYPFIPPPKLLNSICILEPQKRTTVAPLPSIACAGWTTRCKGVAQSTGTGGFLVVRDVTKGGSPASRTHGHWAGTSTAISRWSLVGYPALFLKNSPATGICTGY